MLRFGTAGLRGPLRDGPDGMNVETVTRASAGIADWLRDRCLGGGLVIVGRDARHGSAEFAAATAEVFAAAGFTVLPLPRPLPTPIVAYAVRELKAVAGVQITASHNPATDNGYKLYLDGGSQLVPPADTEIERRIEAVTAPVPRSDPASAAPDPGLLSLPADASVAQMGEEIVRRYLARVAELPTRIGGAAPATSRRAPTIPAGATTRPPAAEAPPTPDEARITDVGTARMSANPVAGAGAPDAGADPASGSGTPTSPTARPGTGGLTTPTTTSGAGGSSFSGATARIGGTTAGGDEVSAANVRATPTTGAAGAYGLESAVDTVGTSGGDGAERLWRRPVRIALTAMHGVGGELAVRALRAAGFADVEVVTEQFAADPDFPTVAFPNPEEPGAADLLLALAERVGADVAIALDPDADRCAVGVPGRGGWRMLRGDETGVLLGDYVLRTAAPGVLVATTIVSSRLLSKLAPARGARYAETLTGFKWLARAGDGLVYAYEEAIGHCVDPAAVRDKDGISAAVAVVDLVARLRAAGRSVDDVLDDYAVEFGVHAGAQVSLRLADATEAAAVVARLRAEPPTEIAGEPVTSTDLLQVRGRMRTDALIFEGDALRLVVRPSGTEPKLKCYLETFEPVPDPAQLATARAAAEQRLAGIREYCEKL
ncbi:phospho-sugar mutase [Nocardia otitidiscaviarum]|nr:phospho-sugar mutase [Nocardia otitidiscaviarum]MBF6179797.1 phospho-sugar mutase [Nocardia otitidiscaviarum]